MFMLGLSCRPAVVDEGTDETVERVDQSPVTPPEGPESILHLSQQDQEISLAVALGEEWGQALLKELVEQNSGTLNIEGVTKVGAILERELTSMGFETHWEHPEVNERRAGHLIAHRSGSSYRILMVVHMDTVFETGADGSAFSIEDGIARGPGVHDMKGGIVVALSALRALHHAGELEGSSITFIAIGDEESPAQPLELDRKILRDYAEQSDYALVFEGRDDTHPGIVTGRRGISSWELFVTSGGGHSSRILTSELGAGSAYESARIINMLRTELVEPGLTVNIGYGAVGSQISDQQSGIVVQGKLNRVPEQALYKGDLRYTTFVQRDDAQKRMQAIVEVGLLGTVADIRFMDLYPPMEATPGNENLRDLMEQVSLMLTEEAQPAVDPIYRGASDACFISGTIPVIDGLGPSGGGDHSREEYVDLSSITPSATRTAVLISRIFAMGC